MNETPRNPIEGDASARRLPDRYAVREEEDGTGYLTCREAPTVRLVMEDGAVPASSARSAPSGTLFLDGAA